MFSLVHAINDKGQVLVWVYSCFDVVLMLCCVVLVPLRP